jgi:hypothetical protein
LGIKAGNRQVGRFIKHVARFKYYWRLTFYLVYHTTFDDIPNYRAVIDVKASFLVRQYFDLPDGWPLDNSERL